MTAKRMSRATLIGVAVLFLSPFVVALVLNRFGWHPVGTRNHGELVQPPQLLGDIALRDQDGDVLTLANPDHRFTLMVVMPESCGSDCIERLDQLHRVRISLGRHANKLAIVLLSARPPAPLPPAMRVLDRDAQARLSAVTPTLTGAMPWTALLVDDKSYLMLRFPPDLEARLIRRDLGRVIK